MEEYFKDLTQIRRHFIDILHQYDLDQLIFIPEGYQNHIFWNCAHVLVTQQLMTHYLSDNKMIVSNDWVMRYKRGTVGDENVTKDDVRFLIKLLQSSVIQLRKDYEAENLALFRPYQTSFGINLECVEDAIRFNNLHEMWHLGYIRAMEKKIII